MAEVTKKMRISLVLFIVISISLFPIIADATENQEEKTVFNPRKEMSFPPMYTNGLTISLRGAPLFNGIEIVIANT